MRTIVGMLAVLLAGAVIVLIVLWARGGSGPAAGGDTRPVEPLAASTPEPGPAAPTAPSPSATPAASTPAAQSATATVPGTAAGQQLPASCDQLYSPALVETFTTGNLVLNPARLNNPGEELSIGPDDEQLTTLIEQNESLRCVWTTAEGGSGVGVGTTVVLVDPAEREVVANRLRALGFTCFDERAGLRCETEVSSVDGTFGESHFLRDDLWLSTRYGDVPLPEGYTLDIINNLWPEGK